VIVQAAGVGFVGHGHRAAVYNLDNAERAPIRLRRADQDVASIAGAPRASLNSFMTGCDQSGPRLTNREGFHKDDYWMGRNLA